LLGKRTSTAGIRVKRAARTEPGGRIKREKRVKASFLQVMMMNKEILRLVKSLVIYGAQ